MSEQRWLSLDMLATTLRLPKAIIRGLVKKGCLVRIKTAAGDRYLDPTPEYAAQLKIASVIHQKLYTIPEGVTEKALLTTAEVGEILGMTPKNAQNWLTRHKPQSFKIRARLRLYTVAGIRECLWRREGRYLSKQKAPFLIPELVAFFRKHYAEETALIPTDKEFRQDEILQRKLERLAQMGESAQMDFAAKVELARKIVQILESTRRESDQRSSSSRS